MINTFGTCHLGVGWSSELSQLIRFEQLIKVIDNTKPFSILDYGCGYGALYDYMKLYFKEYDYMGYDISETMLKKSRMIHNKEKAVWINKINENEKFDYIVSSGIFNLRLDISDKEWHEYIIDTLNQFNNISKKGFAFNILTSYSDKEKMRNELYYANPTFFFDYCKKHFSKQIALLHDYGLYEFTLIIRK